MNEPTSRLVVEVLGDLASADPERRWQAAESIRLLGRDANAQAAKPLMALLEQDPSTKVRIAAAYTLAGVSPVPDNLIPFVLNGLLSVRSDVRAWCCTILGESRSTSPAVRDVLRAVADHDPDADVQWRAMKAVGELASAMDAEN